MNKTSSSIIGCLLVVFSQNSLMAQSSEGTIQCRFPKPKMNLEQCLSSERIAVEVKLTCENESENCVKETVKSLKTKCVYAATVQSVALDNILNNVEDDVNNDKCASLEGADSCEQRVACVEYRMAEVVAELSQIGSSDFYAVNPEVDEDAISNATLALNELSKSKSNLVKKMSQSSEQPMALY